MHVGLLPVDLNGRINSIGHGPARSGAESRLNLPQLATEVRLNAETRQALDSVLEEWASDPEHATKPAVSRQLIGAFPAELRNGCREMLSDFEPMTRVDRNLSVRIL